MDLSQVRLVHEVLELEQRIRKGVVRAHQWHYFEKVFHSVGTTHFKRLASVGVDLTAIDALRMNGLKPKPVRTEVPDIIKVERIESVRVALGAVQQVVKRAALSKGRPGGLNGAVNR